MSITSSLVSDKWDQCANKICCQVDVKVENDCKQQWTLPFLLHPVKPSSTSEKMCNKLSKLASKVCLHVECNGKDISNSNQIKLIELNGLNSLHKHIELIGLVGHSKLTELSGLVGHNGLIGLIKLLKLDGFVGAQLIVVTSNTKIQFIQ